MRSTPVMNFMARATVCLIACSLFSSPATADDSSNNTGMYENYKSDKQKFLDDFAGASLKLDRQDLVPVLFSSIHYLSKYPLPDKFPTITFLPSADLSQLACNSRCMVLGHYAGGEIIYLDEKLKPESNLLIARSYSMSWCIICSIQLYRKLKCCPQTKRNVYFGTSVNKRLMPSKMHSWWWCRARSGLGIFRLVQIACL